MANLSQLVIPHVRFCMGQERASLMSLAVVLGKCDTHSRRLRKRFKSVNTGMCTWLTDQIFDSMAFKSPEDVAVTLQGEVLSTLRSSCTLFTVPKPR